jgi:hypothetical protein
MPFLKGDVKDSPRKGLLYWSDDGDLLAIRVLDWKIFFIEQYEQGFSIQIAMNEKWMIRCLRFVAKLPRGRPRWWTVLFM